jgi:hypothetical protein
MPKIRNKLKFRSAEMALLVVIVSKVISSELECSSERGWRSERWNMESPSVWKKHYPDENNAPEKLLGFTVA